MPTALVTDAERGSAVTIIRSLGRHGWDVVAAASNRIVPGFYSRYASAVVRYPDPTAEPDGALDTIAAASRRYAVDLVIPVTDEVILPLSAARHRLPAGCRIAIADAAAVDVVADKIATVELARSLAIPVPDSVAVNPGEDAAAYAEQLGWPVVVKPRRSYDWRPGRRATRRWVRYARDQSQLRAAVEAAGTDGVLLQRYHHGTGRAVSLLTYEGIPLAAFQYRRLREVPPSGGASALRESEELAPELYASGCRLLGALRWTGLAMVEFKTGASGSVLMEVNGRVWGALPLAVASGIDFPARLADLYVNGPPPPGISAAVDYQVGVRSRDLTLEQAWIGDVLLRRTPPVGVLPPRRAAVGVALRLFSRRDGYDILDRHDLRPGLLEVAKVLSKPGREGVARLRRRPRP